MCSRRRDRQTATRKAVPSVLLTFLSLVPFAAMTQIFKNKDEVEEFLHNLGTEYRFSCYKEFNAEGCHLLGDFLHVIRDDYQRAHSVYSFACKQFKYSKSCNMLGLFTFEGRGVKKNVPLALTHFAVACENGSADGCYHMGQMLSGKDDDVRGAGVKPDMKKAMAALEKGCELGQANSCFEAGSFYLHGEELGQPKDPVKGFHLMELACNNFAPHFEACNNLMLMHKRGVGTKKDPEAAAKVQEKLDDYISMINKKRFLEMQQGT